MRVDSSVSATLSLVSITTSIMLQLAHKKSKMFRLSSFFLFFGAASFAPEVTATYCGCKLCTQAVWDSIATGTGGSHSCGSRITWLKTQEGKSEKESCDQVAREFYTCTCRHMCKFLDDPDPSKLIWSDEFNVDGPPNPSNWGYDIGAGGWGNGESEYYTKLPGNVKVTNGILRITAKKEPGYSVPYTSARIVTRGLRYFKYGRVQFRARIANCKAKGTWPALWMLPEKWVYGDWPNSGEFDVMEASGQWDNKFLQVTHTKAFHGANPRGGDIALSKDDWHTFEINWEPDRAQFAIDGQIVFEWFGTDSSSTWPYDQDFHIIMNVAVGGALGGTIDESAFEGNGQTMEIDWVRVYKHTPSCPSPATSPTSITVQAECYSWMQGVQTQDTSDENGGKNVAYIDTDDWMSYSEVTIPSTGTYKVEYRVANGSSGGGSLQLEKAGGTQVYGKVDIPNTGGWQNWQTVSHTVNLDAGPIAFGIKATGGGWNINWFRMSLTSLPTTTEPTTMKPMSTPTTLKPTTRKPTTRKPSTRKPTTRKPTQVPTNEPTTESPTTNAPTTDSPTTDSPTTESPTTQSPTTQSPTTESPTTSQPTSKPTSAKPTTRKPSTRKPTTRKPSTRKPTTVL